MNRRITPIIVPTFNDNPFLYTAQPNITASKMNISEDEAAAGTAANVLATMFVNAATTSNSVSHANIENNIIPFLPILA
ncbi:hypothetical protein SDC9_58497 [bioreactor metagenome]|uniref:Uncharacterized protein n=1 Tax=bioreactor metagenome TaxID=1076179 RepID=A0A644X7K4_9ZZZZ